MSETDLDALEVAARRILTRLLESRGVQFVSSRGVTALAGGASYFLAGVEREPQRAARFADWLMDQDEVADLFVDDEQLEAMLASEWDGQLSRVESRPARTARNAQLEAAIVEMPDCVEHYLVYGDWLQARGDPYGELITRQLAAHGPGATQASARRAYAFLDAHANELLGPMAEYLRKVLHFEWHMGFIRAARVGRAPADTDRYQGEIMLRWLLEHRACLLLRSLELQSCERQPSAQTQAMVDVLAARPPAGLELLRITGGRDAVDARALLDGLPRLRELSLSAMRLELKPMVLARLTRLELGSGVLGASLPAAFASSLPALESLTLLGYLPVAGSEVEALYAQPFPRLRQLRTYGHDQLLERLAGSALLAQLEVLDLSGGGLRDDAIHELLIPRRRQFLHLQRLVLDDNALSEDAVAALLDALGALQISAAGQRPPPGTYDDDEYYDEVME